MARLDDLTTLVRESYNAKNPTRADWADWLAENHVFVVADKAQLLAQRFGANAELVQAAAMLHDIADIKISRFDDRHESISLELARDFLHRTGFLPEEADLIVDDAIRYHSCHDGNVPQSLEGKVLATADALAHIQTNFYVYGAWAMGKEGVSLNDLKKWALKKLDRDFNDKILFPEVREECRADYEHLKFMFSL